MFPPTLTTLAVLPNASCPSPPSGKPVCRQAPVLGTMHLIRYLVLFYVQSRDALTGDQPVQ